MATENISTGNFYRILKDKATSTWDRISFWTHASDVELSSGTSLETDLSNKTTQISNIQTDFAQIEPTSVSTHVYTKGMMLVYNNQLYRVKSAIASGETLVVGTNIEEASVGTLSNMLSASNGNQFYFDVKDGTYGFYPSASKTASEFVPFGGSLPLGVVYGTYSSGNGNLYRFVWNPIADETNTPIQMNRGSSNPCGYITYNGQNIMSWSNAGYMHDAFYFYLDAVVGLRTSLGDFAAGQRIISCEPWGEWTVYCVIYSLL